MVDSFGNKGELREKFPKFRFNPLKRCSERSVVVAKYNKNNKKTKAKLFIKELYYY